ncbi:MAG: hypothetical protein IJ587_05825 [Synergistaceae bacterium]|nr:hypothetical protein [Synergistaceae bacterium]
MANLVFTSLKFDRSYKNRDGASFSASLKQLQLTSAEYVSTDSQMPMSSQDAGKNDNSQLAKTANAGMTTVSLQSVSAVAANRYEAAYARPSSSAPLTRRTGAYDGLTITTS